MKRSGLGGALALVLLAGGASAQAVPDAVPANTQELRDFRIDPQPPPPPPPPAAETPAPVAAPAPEPAPVPAPVVNETVPASTRVAPARTRRPLRPTETRRPAPRVRSDAPEPASLDETPAAQPPAVVPQQLPPVPQVDPNAPAPIAPTPVKEDTRGDGISNALLPLAAGLGLAALVGGLLWRRRKRPAAFVEESGVIDDAPEPLPVVESEAAIPPPNRVTHAPRPSLTVAFKPAAAGATETIASVDYTLVVTNTGDAPASKVRMEARMFAMGQDHDAALAAFFADPLERPTPIASAIPPGVEAALRAQVTLPRDAVNPIQVRDRIVFVPLVAFNVLYEYYDADGGLQHGQTSMSYVVGRENRPPAEKMAPFRLDQGPRIYREVGQRVHQLRQVA